MPKKNFTVLSLLVFLSISNLSFAQTDQDQTKNLTCQEIRSEAIEICNFCRSSSLDSKNVVSDPKYFSQESFLCSELIQLSSNSDSTKSFFKNSTTKINCSNIEQTQCQTSSTTSISPPTLKPSNSEFFNVTDPNTGLLANSAQGSSFQKAVKENGPILGPILLIINFLTGIIATLAILALVIGGFFMITARGEESQITRGKDIVKNSLIAIVIVLGSYTLIRTIQATILLILN